VVIKDITAAKCKAFFQLITEWPINQLAYEKVLRVRRSAVEHYSNKYAQ